MSKQEYETLFLEDHTKHILFTINAPTKTPNKAVTIKATIENNLQRGQKQDLKMRQRISTSGSLKGRDTYFEIPICFVFSSCRSCST